MSKKHFVAMAAAIAKVADEAERRRLCEEIGVECARMNDKFKWSVWRDACGVSP
jgi:hypothetical protein